MAQFHQDEPGALYAYEVGADGAPSNNYVDYMELPERAQGVAVSDDTLYVSQSLGRHEGSTLLSTPRVPMGEPLPPVEEWDSRELPNMSEGITLDDDGDLYITTSPAPASTLRTRTSGSG